MWTRRWAGGRIGASGRARARGCPPRGRWRVGDGEAGPAAGKRQRRRRRDALRREFDGPAVRRFSRAQRSRGPG
eukprot:5303418-Alexandrium_andersonii.AAC.1